MPLGTGDAAEHPEHHRAQLVGRGLELYVAGGRQEHVADRHPGQDETGGRHPAPPASQPEHQRSGDQRSHESCGWDTEAEQGCSAAQGDDKDGSERGSVGEAEHDRIGQGVGDHGLQHRSGQGEPRPGEGRENHTRRAERPHDLVERDVVGRPPDPRDVVQHDPPHVVQRHGHRAGADGDEHDHDEQERQDTECDGGAAAARWGQNASGWSFFAIRSTARSLSGLR